ncbi:hypothetical protein N431DRAFT_466747 [Stipitochalara longipes BDJ]|nr:hypothetical protein N431DRAFT_466747 [Stipitochalara longipes BDJ]
MGADHSKTQSYITRHELAIAPNLKTPALLIALASDKENDKKYYKEARAQYRKINYVVSLANHEEFRDMPSKDLKLIRHLTMVFTQENPDHRFGGLDIAGSLAKVCNRFETITVDMTCEDENLNNPLIFANSFLEWAIMSSTTGVKRVVAVFDTSRQLSTHLESSFVSYMCHHMGLGDAKVDDQVLSCSYGASIKALRWENESGASLRIKETRLERQH